MNKVDVWDLVRSIAGRMKFSCTSLGPEEAFALALLDLKDKIDNGQKERDRLVNQRLMNNIHDAHSEQDICPKCGSELGFCPQGEYCTNPKCGYSI